jgi:hypothetical protein
VVETPSAETLTVGEQHSLEQEDIEPSVRVLKTEQVEMKVGGLVQLYFAPYAGSDSLIANGDAVTKPGFRLRRAGFGVAGLLGPKLSILIAINAIQSSTEGGTVSDAKIMYDVAPWLRLEAGTTKVPFTRNGLESSRTQTGMERPLVVTSLTTAGRLGVSAQGELVERHFAYYVGGYNGSDGLSQGNQFGGFLAGARFEYRPWGGPPPDPWERVSGLAMAVDAIYENGPSTTRVGYSGDVYAALGGAHVKAEGICDRSTPKDNPVISPTLPDAVKRCGAYGETGYVILTPVVPIQPAARFEIFYDNTALQDAGDVAILDAGLNAQLISYYLRTQLHYIARFQLYGPQRSEDALVLSLQGTF